MWFTAPESLLGSCGTPRTTQEMKESSAFSILLLHIWLNEHQVGTNKRDDGELSDRGRSHDSAGDSVI